MARSCLAILFVSVLIMLSFSHGFCRNLMMNYDTVDKALSVHEEFSTDMIKLDYADAGPNVNSRSAYFLAPPPSPPPPPPKPTRGEGSD